jgi:RNA polymerase sigma-70 factor (ECF subfamily)
MNEKERVFKTAFDAYHQKIYHLCYAYTGDPDIASDLVQDTFLKVWEHLESFQHNSAINTWIYRIAVNTCLSFIKVGKRLQTEKINEQVLESFAEAENTVQSKVSLLYQCIALLQESDRLIITMVLDEIPYPEIAEIAGVSEGNLRVKIHRIKQQLTELYQKYERV